MFWSNWSNLRTLWPTFAYGVVYNSCSMYDAAFRLVNMRRYCLTWSLAGATTSH